VSKGFITPTEEGIRLNLRVSPGAKRTSIEDPYGEGAIRLKVAAPPIDSKANAEVKRFLASLLGVPRSDVVVTLGASSRDKVVAVRGLQQTQTHHLLAPYLG
jgi:uncharacterized protein (TIGR00251 family)